MIAEAIQGRSFQILEKSMELRWARHALLASNIANAETPNYRAVDIDFRATMAELIGQAEEAERPRMELRRTDARHLRPARGDRPRILFSAGDSASFGNDSNSVGLEQQLGRLQHNAAMYGVCVRMLQRQIQEFNSIIQGSQRG